MDLSRYKIDFHKISENHKNTYFVETESFKQVVTGIHKLHNSEVPGALLKTVGCGVSYASSIYVKQRSRNAFHYNTKLTLKNLLEDLLYKLGYDFRPNYK